ncbi:MAG: hypothetical protein Q6358_12810 [Candidatus Brocadiales bacterium]|nr:hypothetical protein [Candidatus Brocadiales bacterium]
MSKNNQIMGSLISLEIELNAIRSFLENVINVADTEYSRIKALSDAGKFLHYDDESNAYFIPMQWEKIAIKTTLGELNALVEWELCNLASKPFFENERRMDGRLRIVYDLKRDKIIALIEDHYKIKLSDLEYYEHINRIRRIVNSFKHRKGFEDYRKDADVFTAFGDKFEVSRKAAFQSIDEVKSFIKELWSKTRQSS